jgi:cobalt-zinc-cadmium resistance protein CzcA
MPVKNKFIFCFAVALMNLSTIIAQQEISMDDALSIALVNHPLARNTVLEEQKDGLMQKRSVDLAPLQAKYWQLNAASGSNNLILLTQDFGSIPEHFRQSKYFRSVSSLNKANRALELDELKRQVKSAYLNLVYYTERLKLMQEHERFFEALISTAEIYLASDSVKELTIVSAGVQYATYQSRMYIAEEELKRAENRLRQLMYLPDGKIIPTQNELELYQIHPDKDLNVRFDPLRHRSRNEAYLDMKEAAIALDKSKLFPAIHAGYIRQHIAGVNNFNGWMLGLSLPLWIQPQRAKIKQAEIDRQINVNEMEYEQFVHSQHIESLKSLLNEYFVQISFSKENLLEEAKLILLEVENDFAEATITDYADTFSKVRQALSARLNHLEYINMYNQTALELEYYTQ